MISMETAIKQNCTDNQIDVVGTFDEPPVIKIENIEEDESPSNSQYTEFEFSPGDRETSSSPDPEEVLDSIYDAATRGDSISLQNLIYANPDKSGDNNSISPTLYNPRKRLKKTVYPERERLVVNIAGGRVISSEKVKTRSPSKRKSAGRKSYSSNKKLLLSSADTADVVNFANIVNTKDSSNHSNRLLQDKGRAEAEKQHHAIPVQQQTVNVGNLIDYSVLTKALSKTLESKLLESENNDVKIVIFCNNKPIQSFSVKSNQAHGDDSGDKQGPEVSVTHSQSSEVSRSKLPAVVLESAASQFGFWENSAEIIKQAGRPASPNEPNQPVKTIVRKRNDSIVSVVNVSNLSTSSLIPGAPLIAQASSSSSGLPVLYTSPKVPTLLGPFTADGLAQGFPGVPVVKGIPILSNRQGTLHVKAPGVLFGNSAPKTGLIGNPQATGILTDPTQTPGFIGNTPPTTNGINSILTIQEAKASCSKSSFGVLNQAKITQASSKLGIVVNEKGVATATANIAGAWAQSSSVEQTAGASAESADKPKAVDSEEEGDKLVINEHSEDSGIQGITGAGSVAVDENGNGLLTPVQCDQCNKRFKLKRYLNRHKIRVHRETSDSNLISARPVGVPISTGSRPSPPKTVHLLGKGHRIETVAVVPGTVREGGVTANVEVNLEKGGNESELLYLGEKQKFINLSELFTGQEDSCKSRLNRDDVGVNSDEADSDSELVRVKREPSAESDDSVTKYIKSLIDDSDVTFEEVGTQFADRGKRALFHKTAPEIKLVTAAGLLAGKKPKPSRIVRNENGLPLTPEGFIEPVYVCEECGKFYRARKTLKDHYFRTHAKKPEDEPLYLYISGNKYQCPICFNNFHSGSELVAHTKKHTGELQIPCKLCGKIYSSVHVLRRHIENIHTELRPRPFQCELCDYAASNRWHLKEHYRRHTGEQPYQCPICQKSFSHQGTMNRHCKVIHKFEVASQRQFAQNTISDLPILPLPEETESSSDTGPSGSATVDTIGYNTDQGKQDIDVCDTSSPQQAPELNSSFLHQSSELDGSAKGSPDLEEDPSLEVDLTLVKSEPLDDTSE